MASFSLQYDEYKSPMDNIGMQDSLLSRFDMIFVVLDEMDPDHDRRISEHVLRMHRYRNPGEQVSFAKIKHIEVVNILPHHRKILPISSLAKFLFIP